MYVCLWPFIVLSLIALKIKRQLFRNRTFRAPVLVDNTKNYINAVSLVSVWAVSSKNHSELVMSKRKIDDDLLSSGSSDSAESLDSTGEELRPTKRRNVRFSEKIVFSFPRTQGASCVPSTGGSTLGMKHTHCFVEHLKLSDEFRTQNEDSSESELEEEGNIFLPIPHKVRKAILKAAGVKKINKQEADECMQIRCSRQVCGCDCKSSCEPTSCFCILNGINCQVDRDGFPCGCTRVDCQNPNGRHEYDPASVRKHFIDTVLRLRENKYIWNEERPNSNSSPSNMTEQMFPAFAVV